MRQRNPTPTPRPLKIHTMLAMQTIWTDDLWSETLEYLLSRVGTTEAIFMSMLIVEDNTIDSPHKIDYLRPFQAYPPSVTLAAFDLARTRPRNVR